MFGSPSGDERSRVLDSAAAAAVNPFASLMIG